MSKRLKRVLISIALLALIAGLWIGWWLLKLDAAARHVIWQANEGGLTLTYFPLKDHAVVLAGSDYAPGEKLTWTLTDPGATQWILAAPVVPPPEELLGRAWIGKPDTSLAGDPKPHPTFGLNASSAVGLAKLYHDASGTQRENIIWQLERACENADTFCAALRTVQDLAGKHSAIRYIDDPNQFKAADDTSLAEQEAEAVTIAKRYLERQFGKELAGTFTLASADWGYQVDFTNLQCVTDSNGEGEPIPEGFGEVFLSRELEVLEANVGP